MSERQSCIFRLHVQFCLKGAQLYLNISRKRIPKLSLCSHLSESHGHIKKTIVTEKSQCVYIGPYTAASRYVYK